MLTMIPRRPIRIGNSSGAIGDGPDQLYRLAIEGPIDAIFSDYLAEVNIPWRALEMSEHPELGYEQSPLIQLRWESAAEQIVNRGIKWVHDGGALNPRGLYEEIKKVLDSKGLLGKTKLAWVEGDNVVDTVKANLAPGQTAAKVYPHLDILGQTLNDAFSKEGDVDQILSANAYVGLRGILAALEAGAQIIVCGRVCDASPVMALAAWWHGWSLTDWDRLAGSLVAGHITECGPYTTGGNFCDFCNLFPDPGSPESKFYDLGYPIIELAHDGTCMITQHPGSNGAVTEDTVTAQLVYEIQGPKYLNPDVTANLENVHVEAFSGEKNKVRVWGITGSPPPPTTKLAVCSIGGYQAEMSLFAVGLNIREKYESWKMQVMRKIDPSKFLKIAIDLYGYGLHSIPPSEDSESGSHRNNTTKNFDPQSQKECTAMIRHFVQAETKDVITRFMNSFFTMGMAGYPGLCTSLDSRTGVPKPFIKYIPAVISQQDVSMRVHVGNGTIGHAPDAPQTIDIPTIQEEHTEPFLGQVSYDPQDTKDLADFGPTLRVPLGTLVLARSGDKGGNANVGFWVRNEDSEAWPWLRSLLTIDKLRALLGKDAYPSHAHDLTWNSNLQPYKITRFEMPHIRAVHFVIFGILEDGVSSSSLVDPLGKSVGEFLRAREVDVPEKFLRRSGFSI
ncbi:hypothetical protein EV361DRAFT_899272 [Lentinula raphanica]|uniref:DUF1446-domain-containing protein n=1 Tax=Lentinula raphanica TaxID=153919 RepID=A0AA38PL87_9AGAR|nr:hypothetical protein F5878DRAFT_600519 [Lentinula raphanica]KAJ3973596.1 hypothetical protein EV361DRAFT_899272 [Lentinula raphanica]